MNMQFRYIRLTSLINPRIESSCLLNESIAKRYTHTGFSCATNLHVAAENQWKSIDN